MGKKLENLLESVNALFHQCIVGENYMLHNYAICGGLEPYRRGLTMTHFLGVKVENKILRKCFGGHYLIKLMHIPRWRKVICYLMIPLVVA